MVRLRAGSPGDVRLPYKGLGKRREREGRGGETLRRQNGQASELEVVSERSTTRSRILAEDWGP